MSKECIHFLGHSVDYSIVYACVKASDAMLDTARGRRCQFAVCHTVCEDDRNWYLQMPHLVLFITLQQLTSAP